MDCKDACFASSTRIVESVVQGYALSSMLSDEEKEELFVRVHSVIQLFLANEYPREIVEEKTIVKLCIKLETQYMIMFLSNFLYMKHWIYTIMMKKCTRVFDHIYR